MIQNDLGPERSNTKLAQKEPFFFVCFVNASVFKYLD